jgi:hypothetical protein
MISFLNVSQVSGQDVSSDFVVLCRTQTFLKAPHLAVNISCLHKHMFYFPVHPLCLFEVGRRSFYVCFFIIYEVRVRL